MMILRFVMLTILVAGLLGLTGHVLTTPETRKQVRYPVTLLLLALMITLGITFAEANL